jgi:hypothetical protein
MGSKKTAIALSVLAFVLFISHANAQGSAQLSANQSAGKTAMVATVNIYNSKIIKQDGDDITVGFDINNREGSQPDIHYAVQLVDKSDRSVAYENIYDKAVVLNANDTVHEEVSFTASSYLEGTYEVWIISRTSNGLPLGQGIAGTVSLEGTGQYVEISVNSCFLTLYDSKSQTKYTLLQGVDISPQETVLLNCAVTNHFQKSVTVSPVFGTYWRSAFGEEVRTNNPQQSSITLSSQETKNVQFILPKAGEPQSYDVFMSLNDAQGNDVSNSIDAHYVIQGASATIQNLTLDKNYYAKGDTAEVSLFWTGSADSFTGARGQATSLDSTTLAIAIKNASGDSCIAETNEDISNQTQSGILSFKIPVTQDCLNPHVLASIKDNNGTILDTADFSLTSQNVPHSSATLVSHNSLIKIKEIIITAAALLALIPLAVSLVIFIKKRRTGNYSKVILLLLLFGGSLFVSTGQAKADTFWVYPVTTTGYDVGSGQNESYSPAMYSVGLDKPAYAPGGTITATASTMVQSTCTNVWAAQEAAVAFNTTNATLYAASAAMGTVAFDNEANNGSASGPAQTTPGGYSAVFQGGAFGMNCTYSNGVSNCLNGGFGLGGGYSMPYTVAASTCNPSSVTNGTVNQSNCTITCNSGYTLSGSSCVAVQAPVGECCSQWGYSCTFTGYSDKACTQKTGGGSPECISSYSYGYDYVDINDGCRVNGSAYRTITCGGADSCCMGTMYYASSACAASTCTGQTCSDSCGNQYAGTKSCCTDTSWSPDQSSICSGQSFTQTGNPCNDSRQSTGTELGVSGTCNPNATSKLWQQAPISSDSLCGNGITAQNIALSGNSYSWTCPGLCGGTDASCSAQRDMNWKEVTP